MIFLNKNFFTEVKNNKHIIHDKKIYSLKV